MFVLGTATANVEVEPIHRVRLQAQRGHYLIASASENAKGTPISLSRCKSLLAGLIGGLTDKEKKHLKDPFAKLERRMIGCGTSGGCTPAHTQSFQGRDGYHADFEVGAGIVCLQ